MTRPVMREWVSFDSLSPLLAFEGLHLLDHAEHALEDMASEVVDYAQANAPWEDRTGAARAGLTAEVSREGLEVVLSLYHTVDYGEWLELIQSGRFAIIMPTLEHFSGEAMRRTGATYEGEEGEGL